MSDVGNVHQNQKVFIHREWSSFPAFFLGDPRIGLPRNDQSPASRSDPAYSTGPSQKEMSPGKSAETGRGEWR